MTIEAKYYEISPIFMVRFCETSRLEVKIYSIKVVFSQYTSIVRCYMVIKQIYTRIIHRLMSCMVSVCIILRCNNQIKVSVGDNTSRFHKKCHYNGFRVSVRGEGVG